MKVYVDKIPQEGLELRGQIDPQKLSLNKNLQGMTFIGQLKAAARVKKTGGEVFIDINFEAPAEYTCARCLAKFQSVFKKDFSVSYEVKPGDILDIDEDIRQEMILDYPMKVVCKPDCKGLCANCGQNLNISDCDCKNKSGGF